MGGTCVTHGEKRNAYKILWETRKEREYVVVINIDGRMILEWNFKKYYVRTYIGLLWLMAGVSYRLL
jgi:hypothetical protein